MASLNLNAVPPPATIVQLQQPVQVNPNTDKGTSIWSYIDDLDHVYRQKMLIELTKSINTQYNQISNSHFFGFEQLSTYLNTCLSGRPYVFIAQ